MADVWFALPGDPSIATGGYVYARRLVAALPATGWCPHLLTLPASFPFPSGPDLEAARDALAGVPTGAPALIDGLAFGALPRMLLDTLTCRAIALIHHPLALESGLTEADVRHFKASETAALGAARCVIATSAHTARVLASDYGVPPDRVHVAPPGVDGAQRAAGSREGLCMLSVGTVTPRKGFDILVRALARLTDLTWSCRIVGSLTRSPETAADVGALIAHLGLDRRIALAGELTGPALDRAYDQADLFVLASRYEGYGMAVAEALARGLPVIACDGGAVRDTLPGGAGHLVPVEDIDALSKALRAVLSDDAARTRLANAAWAHAHTLPRWPETAAAVAKVLNRVVA